MAAGLCTQDSFCALANTLANTDMELIDLMRYNR